MARTIYSIILLYYIETISKQYFILYIMIDRNTNYYYIDYQFRY